MSSNQKKLVTKKFKMIDNDINIYVNWAIVSIKKQRLSHQFKTHQNHLYEVQGRYTLNISRRDAKQYVNSEYKNLCGCINVTKGVT